MSENLTLRRAGAMDAAAIQQVTREAYAKWIDIIGRKPKPMTVDYEEALRSNRFDLLESSVQLIAVIETIAKADHLLIENIAVAPRFQKRGYGRMLMSHAEGIAAEASFAGIRLYTNKSFTGNVALYTRLGYAVHREEPFGGGIIVHMHKSLPQRA